MIPTLHARIGDLLYVHGSSASRTVRALGEGIPACVTVTLLDGIVLARSVFEHSINYRSVVVLGTATPVTDPDEKNTVLEAFTEKLLPGRWADARQPTRKELKATGRPVTPDRRGVGEGAHRLPRTTATSPDAELDVWAGHIPLVAARSCARAGAGPGPGSRFPPTHSATAGRPHRLSTRRPRLALPPSQPRRQK